MSVSFLGHVPRLKIAVIGSGIAGLSAAWLLNKNHDVTVFEKQEWLGGHSNTIVFSKTVHIKLGKTPRLYRLHLNFLGGLHKKK